MKLYLKYLWIVSVLLPGLFKIAELHYFRFEHMIGKNDKQLTNEFNMPRTLVPSVISLNEQYCWSWLPVSLLKELEEEQTKLQRETIIIRAQREKFMKIGDEVLFMSIWLA